MPAFKLTLDANRACQVFVLPVLFAAALVAIVPNGLLAQNANPPSPPASRLPPLTENNFFEGTSDEFTTGPNTKPLGNYFAPSDSQFSSKPQHQQWNEDILQSTTISRYKNSFYQKTTVFGGWIAKDGDSGLGVSYFRSSIALTVGSPENLLIVSPGFAVDFLEGPSGLDVPGNLYSLTLNLIWRRKLSNRWGTLVGVLPGAYSDFENSVDDGFRLGGFVAVSWDVFPEQLTLFGGVVYLDRNDFGLLPAAGLIWTPTSDLRVDLMFPRPKISKRIAHVPFVSEDWLYVASSLGGGSFEVVRASGMQDELTLRDFRLTLGLERIRDGGTGWYAEIGWIFARRLDYRSSMREINFGDSVGIEAGFSF